MLGQRTQKRGFRITYDRITMGDDDSINVQTSDLFDGGSEGSAVLDQETEQATHPWKLVEASGRSQEPLRPSSSFGRQVEHEIGQDERP